MAIMIDDIIKLLKVTGEVATETLKGMNPEKYAEAVEKMCDDNRCDEDFDAMAEIIRADENLDTTEKLELLRQVSEARIKAHMDFKDAAAKRIIEHETNRGQIAVNIAIGLATGGLGLIPVAINHSYNKKKRVA